MNPAWLPVCPVDRLPAERGVAALLGRTQVAVFRTVDGGLHALDNRDPVSGANVMSRGLVGSRGDRPTVAAPLFKQVYDLQTGQCLDEPALQVRVYPVRVRDGLVEVCLATAEPGPRSVPGPAARRDVLSDA